MARSPSGKAEVCKTSIGGSIPPRASKKQPSALSFRPSAKTLILVIPVTADCAATAAHLIMFMDRFAIINNRKRAIIALIHSVFFLGVAGVQLAISHAEPLASRPGRMTGGMVLLMIYVIVTTVLLILLGFSRCTREKLYFALCAASACFGLVRILLGDPVLHANVLRVLLLFCAVIIGTGILRSHSAAISAKGAEAR
jgi:hypothetical protein